MADEHGKAVNNRPSVDTGWSGGLHNDGRGHVASVPVKGGETNCGEEDGHSYHCLHITTKDIPRSSIFNLGYAVEVHCTRMTGWQLVVNKKVIAEEYCKPENWLILDVGGVEIVNSRDRKRDDDGWGA